MSESCLVDARGLLCPWPALRLARAAREMGQGRLRMLADDPAAPREVEAMCSERGWAFEKVDETEFVVTVSPA